MPTTRLATVKKTPRWPASAHFIRTALVRLCHHRVTPLHPIDMRPGPTDTFHTLVTPTKDGTPAKNGQFVTTAKCAPPHWPPAAIDGLSSCRPRERAPGGCGVVCTRYHRLGQANSYHGIADRSYMLCMRTSLCSYVGVVIPPLGSLAAMASKSIYNHGLQ